MDRAVSTVLDVTLCLLLIGVSVGTLAITIPNQNQPPTVDSDPATASISTMTATVSTGEHGESHATFAEHLAQAAVLHTTIDGHHLTTAPYPDNVERTIGPRIDDRIHITVRWTPYRGAPIQSELSVGQPPPPTADVAATTVAVDSGMTVPDQRRSLSFGSVSTSIANAYIQRLFPPERTRVNLVDPRTAESTASRYRAVAETLGVHIEQPLADALPRHANERLADELASRLEADLRTKYETGDAVQHDEHISEVTIVVQRWER